jgi:CRISP-associated protein Cas1
MIGRVVEIADDNRHLSLFRGFLSISEKGREGVRQEVGRVMLDGLAALICSAQGLSYTNAVLLELVARDVAVVLCGRNHQPEAILWPVAGHGMVTARLKAQMSFKDAPRRRLWRAVVRAKVAQQSATLQAVGAVGHSVLDDLALRVRPGDPDNIEAQAARRYWPALLGEDFRRDADAGGANALLNYGYAILRAGMARAVMGAGLHPALGLHHDNMRNPMCLVDDLMEPFRPLTDRVVVQFLRAGIDSVTPEAKRALAAILVQDLLTAHGMSPVFIQQVRLAQSLATVQAEGKGELDLPPPQPPLIALSNSRGGGIVPSEDDDTLG